MDNVDFAAGIFLVLILLGVSSFFAFVMFLGEYFARKLIKHLIKRKHLKKRADSSSCNPDEDNKSVGVWVCSAEGIYKCSECEAGSYRKTPYCWQCGAEMAFYEDED